MDSLEFLDDSYSICVIPPNSNHWTVTLFLIGILGMFLIKKTASDLAQTRKDYLGAVDENID